MDKLVLIDGNSLLNRAYYATPLFTAKNGLPTNGIFGFIKLLLKLISDKKPTYLVVAFDLHAPTFRHEMYADYKAGRKPMPEELREVAVKRMENPELSLRELLGTLSEPLSRSGLNHRLSRLSRMAEELRTRNAD